MYTYPASTGASFVNYFNKYGLDAYANEVDFVSHSHTFLDQMEGQYQHAWDTRS